MIRLQDGNDLVADENALKDAGAATRRPSLPLIRTHIGYGSPERNSYKAHGSPLGENDVRKTKQN